MALEMLLNMNSVTACPDWTACCPGLRSSRVITTNLLLTYVITLSIKFFTNINIIIKQNKFFLTFFQKIFKLFCNYLIIR